MTDTATVGPITTPRGTFLNSAVIFGLARSAVEEMPEGRSNEAIVPVILAATALECFIMEFAFMASMLAKPSEDPLLRSIGDMIEMVESDRGTVLAKFQMAHVVLTGETFQSAHGPLPEAALLVKLRNALVHLQPDSAQEKTTKIVAGLRTRKLCTPTPDIHETWLVEVGTRDVARWACHSVSNMVTATIDAMKSRASTPPTQAFAMMMSHINFTCPR